MNGTRPQFNFPKPPLTPAQESARRRLIELAFRVRDMLRRGAA